MFNFISYFTFVYGCVFVVGALAVMGIANCTYDLNPAIVRHFHYLTAWSQGGSNASEAKDFDQWEK